MESTFKSVESDRFRAGARMSQILWQFEFENKGTDVFYDGRILQREATSETG